MLIATGLIRLGGQIRILSANGEAVAGNVVRGPVVNGERHDGLETFVRFVEADPAVYERFRGGERAGDIGTVGVVPGYVVAGYRGPDVEEDAAVGKNTRGPGAGPVTRAEGLCEAVAPGCRVSADPVVGWLLVGVDYHGVALAYEGLLPKGITNTEGYKHAAKSIALEGYLPMPILRLVVVYGWMATKSVAITCMGWLSMLNTKVVPEELLTSRMRCFLPGVSFAPK